MCVYVCVYMNMIICGYVDICIYHFIAGILFVKFGSERQAIGRPVLEATGLPGGHTA